MRCLEKTPADRWQSAEELLGQLEALATPSAGMTPATPATPLPARAGSRRWWFAVGAAVAALAFVGLALRNGPGAKYETGSTIQVTNSPGLELHPALSPDGKMVAYAAGAIGRMSIFVRQIAGGRAVSLTEGLPGDHRAPRWSADGSQISFFSDLGLFVVPAFGGVPRLVNANLGEGRSSQLVGSVAAMSPDFKRVTYVGPQGHVLVRSASGGEPVRIRISVGKDPHSLVWSPDASRIAFVTDNADFVYSTVGLGNIAPSTIWVAPASGGEAVQISDVVHLNTSPVWTPDGSLLFVSNMQGGRDVYEQPVRSSGRPRGRPARLTTGLNVHTIGLSADGTKLVYSTFSRRANIWSAPIWPNRPTAFSEARAVTDENQLIEGAVVSHDGKWLVFDSNRGGRQQLYKIPAEGGEPVQLTNDSTDHFAARWSADDRRIVFHAWHGGSRDIFIMNADGTGETPLAASGAHEYYPDLSPDGKSVVLRYQPADVMQVAIMTRTDSGWSAPRVLRDSSNLARWSPDGTRIATTGFDGSIRLYPPTGGPGRLLLDTVAAHGSAARYLSWSADGRWIIYAAADPESRISYWAIPSNGGVPRLVMRFPNSALSPRRSEFDSDGKRLYMTFATDESDIWVMDLRKR
jgi:Tol biopolymer transport system component